MQEVIFSPGEVLFPIALLYAVSDSALTLELFFLMTMQITSMSVMFCYD